MAIELTPGKADFVEWSSTKLSRRDGATGKVVWDVLRPQEPGKPPRHYHPWVLWVAGRVQSAVVVQPAPDLNGDGTRDLVWLDRWQTAFLALSGKDGSVLWTYVAELGGPGAYPEGPESPGPARTTVRPDLVLGMPAVADVDRDGVPDLIATMGFLERSDEARGGPRGRPSSSG